MTLEEITWVDSAKSWSAGWYDPNAIIDQVKSWHGKSTTVGYVIHEDERVVLLVQTLDNESDKIANVFLIYVPCILERRVL